MGNAKKNKKNYDLGLSGHLEDVPKHGLYMERFKTAGGVEASAHLH